MLSVVEARERILSAFEPLPTEVVSLTDAIGRVLAEDVTARVTQPPKAVSAMDGYAVRASDTATVPATLRVVAEIPAGHHYKHPLRPGEAVRIFTGAPLPDQADSIVIQEDTERTGDEVIVNEAPHRGAWVRPAGLDFRSGAIGLESGRRLSARDVGLAAAMNRPWVGVHRRPRIAVLATGDEVVLPGEPLSENQIVSSNSLGLCAFITACGGEPMHLGIAPDESVALASRVAAARGCDLLVTAGGASVGAHDLVQGVLQDNGAALDFWKIAMRPGKPLMFGMLDRTPVLGLPGNPVSGLVCATLFLRPAIERMQGRSGRIPVRQAELGADLPANGRREAYLRAVLQDSQSGMPVATAFCTQDSSVLSRMADADALIVRPVEAPPAQAGDAVQIVPLGDGVVHI